MSEVSQLEDQRKDLQSMIERRHMAMRLANNPDFKKLVLQEFCVDECARYAQLSADPAISPAQQADALNLAQAAGHLRRWFQVINQMGNKAEYDLVELDEQLVQARQEGNE